MATILVVDDMQAELELMCQYLSQAGHTTIPVSGAEQALEQARQKAPDLIITDWMMPNMGGMDLCRHLRKYPETANIPVVTCTAKNRDVDRIWAMKQGVVGYVTKPCTAEELLDAVQSAMGK